MDVRKAILVRQRAEIAAGRQWVWAACGYLTGTVDENTEFASVDIRSRNPRFTREAIKANRVVIELLEQIGSEKGGATPAQVALAWVLA
jgi:aryl-alcohol dehydrogenase-like predicted oxidoreductase